jgi:hypothetical protein
MAQNIMAVSKAMPNIMTPNTMTLKIMTLIIILQYIERFSIMTLRPNGILHNDTERNEPQFNDSITTLIDTH